VAIWAWVTHPATDRLTAPSAASSQTPAPTTSTDPNPGALTLTGSFDGVSTYMFRGIRQNATGIALWPVLDLGVAIYSGEGHVKSVVQWESGSRTERTGGTMLLAFGMVVLGLVTFAAMLGFVVLCDRV
jgi:hypothetical protein